jgi:hypothetical protein
MDKDSRIIGIIKTISSENSISEKEVEKIIDLMYEFIYKKATSNDFTSMTLDEFKNTKKNFMIPELMKFYADEVIFKYLNKIKE